MPKLSRQEIIDDMKYQASRIGESLGLILEEPIDPLWLGLLRERAEDLVKDCKDLQKILNNEVSKR